jgi:hypothetical protein
MRLRLRAKEAALRHGGGRQSRRRIWTFVALDPDTKLVPAYRVGKRDLPTATTFNRVQISSDALEAYVDANERA